VAELTLRIEGDGGPGTRVFVLDGEGVLIGSLRGVTRAELAIESTTQPRVTLELCSPGFTFDLRRGVADG
jgi:hypothetical protein